MFSFFFKDIYLNVMLREFYKNGKNDCHTFKFKLQTSVVGIVATFVGFYFVIIDIIIILHEPILRNVS